MATLKHFMFLRAGAVSGSVGSLVSTYYVSPTGNDSAAGTSPATAWQTVAKVNSRIFQPGDQILFACGGTWYTNGISIRGVGGSQLPAYGYKVTVDAYGDLSAGLPIISGWKILNSSGWVLHAAGVWKINVNVDITGNTFTTGAPGANIGRLLVDGDIKTIKCLTLGDLTNDWDYYSDNTTYLYVRSDLNPGTRATEVKASPNIHLGLITASTSTKWRNLHITGSGGHGASLPTSDCDIQKCWFDTLGGCVLSENHANPRYGNGVESFASGARHIVTNNLINDCFDVALTAQGYPMNTSTSGWTDVDFSDNWIARCAWGVEFWNSVSSTLVLGEQGPIGSGFNNVRARRLKLWDIGRGTSRMGRYTAQLWAVFVQTSDIQTPYQPISVSITEMHNCADNLFFFSLPSGSPTFRRSTTDFVLEPSNLRLQAGNRVMRGNQMPTNTAEDFAGFVAATGIGVGSTMTVEPIEQALTPIPDIYTLWRGSL